MQNLTARYNYIYNANLIVKDYEAELPVIYPENYDEILSIYPGPKASAGPDQPASSQSASMDEIIEKAQTIITEKSFSNYIDDSYLLMGKAYFYKNNYYNSTEYFDYTAKAYKNKLPVYIQALTWKIRSLMQLNQLSLASEQLDSLSFYERLQKKQTAEPFAVLTQMQIYSENYKEAIVNLENAIHLSKIKRDRIRWTYILAQLYEQEKNYETAILKYKKVQKSNTDFEMYFNSNLNIIRINHLLSGGTSNKEKQLLALLKDDKNFDYKDQIYYQIGESYREKEDYTKAQQFYIQSVQASTTNQYQKGLSYLRIADLNFNDFRDFLKSKLYYDSTITTLPETYKDYDLILKKTQNLEYLTSRFKAIALEDTLQYVARLPEDQRQAQIEAIAAPVVTEIAPPAFQTSANTPFQTGNTIPGRNQSSSTSYFNNPTALSKGFSDFKRQWGNRKLEENWRQSIKSSFQSTVQNSSDNSGLPAEPGDTIQTSRDKLTLIKEFSEKLPLTPEKLAKSNQNIIEAYYEIASFYQQELKDNNEAIRIYQIILNRFPENNHLAAIYYSLYLSYMDIDKTKSEEYRNLVLSKFSTSVYAKTILDPSFSIKQNELETAANNRYNAIFGQYESNDFTGVINSVNQIAQNSSENYLSPQLAYLKAIAIGRTNNVDSLLSAFQTILDQYPGDRLIVPLVKDHVNYINENIASFKARSIALIDFDPNEPPFMGAPLENVKQKAQLQGTTPSAPSKTDKPATQKNAAIPNQPVVKGNAQPVAADSTQSVTSGPPAVKTDGLFTNASSQLYYFVVDVSDASLTLSSSRFGIGQFNRGNYSGSSLRHQLSEFDNEQLIYVGNFSNFEDAKAYAKGITPQLKQIMKVPANIYTSFVISVENFKKLTNKNLINRYLEFYKNNYPQ